MNSGIDLKKSSFTNHGVAAKVDRSHEICAMCWADDSENQVRFQEFFLIEFYSDYRMQATLDHLHMCQNLLKDKA